MAKIIVVEDDEAILKSLRIRLHAAGHEVICAGDATFGVNKAVKEKPDLAILDIMMPAGGGLWVAECFQRLDGLRDIPLVFITASQDPDLKKKAEDLDAAAFFEKPFDSTELMATVDKLLAPEIQ